VPSIGVYESQAAPFESMLEPQSREIGLSAGHIMCGVCACHQRYHGSELGSSIFLMDCRTSLQLIPTEESKVSRVELNQDEKVLLAIIYRYG